MNVTKHLLSWLLFVACFTSVNAQHPLQRKADKYFGTFSYAKAIPLYEEMVTEGIDPEHAQKRLAECYLLQRDYEKSIPYFERFIHKSGISSNHYFKYGMALKSVGRVKEAAEWLKLYKKTNKNDRLIDRFLKDGNLASVVFNSRERYDIQPVKYNSQFNDFGAIKFGNTIYFSSSRPDSKDERLYDWDNQPWLDIFFIEEGGAFERMTEYIPQRIKGDINSKYHESSVVFSTDYKNDTIAYFTRNNYFEDKEGFYVKKIKDKNLVQKQNNLKIFIAEKNGEEWHVAKNLKINADHYSTGHPSVNENRTKLYFASDRPGGYGGTDIYYCDIHPRGGVGQPINAGPIINTAGDEMFPFINNEGKLFFASDGHVGFGMLDIFATVTDEDGVVTDVINLGKPVNSEKDDFAFFSNEDGTEGYISSNRDGGEGGDDIYKFDFTPSLYVDGFVYDAVNGNPLDSVVVKLTDINTGNFIKQVKTDGRGYYRMFVNRGTKYKLVLNRITHPEKKVTLNLTNLPNKQKKVQKDVYLEPVLDVKILAGLDKIYFDFDKSYIRPDAAKELDKVVKLMVETYPYMTIKLESHTDGVGSHEYNDKLSEARAKATYEYLVASGVPAERILSYKGYGKRQPVNDCKTKWDCPPEILELNRRSEFPIINIFKPDHLKALDPTTPDKKSKTK